jgi:hypothetical protein
MSNTHRVTVDGEIFLGRQDEQDFFRNVLRTVLAPQDDEAPPFIILPVFSPPKAGSVLNRVL